MISWGDIYHVIVATIPLYVAMILAYISVKCCKLFTPEQCSGINKFVAKFSVPLLSFQVISTNNPYKMNLKLILSDFLQKLLAFFVLIAVNKFGSRGGLRLVITGLSLATLPNTLILGIPLLKAMYGDEAEVLLAQIVVLQSLVWYNILLFLFELMAARVASATLPDPEDSENQEAPSDQEDSQSKEEGDDDDDDDNDEEGNRRKRRVNSMNILLTVGRKLMINPNTHATLLGLFWAFIQFGWGVKLPAIIDKSILILSNGGLGMAMFSLGLFMASRASIIACGTRMAALAMAMRFIVGPVLMAASSMAIGLRGKLLRVAIVQAALPQGIVPFVFAKEYNVHPDVLSTGVIFGMLIALPIALAYYFMLAL